MTENYETKLEEMIRAAAGNDDIIPGRPLGRKPKFFIIGDAPSFKDTLTRQPFSGALGGVLANALQTLHERYKTTDQDCYVTYLVKTPLEKAKITRAVIEKEWLEIAQLEFHLSGCESVVALGKIVKTYAGHIPMRPAFMGKKIPEPKMSFMNKMRACLEILNK